MVSLMFDINKSFFEEEDRGGCIVSSNMKKIWAIELDLLNEFSVICKKHHLRWFVHAGTMLGAIRHQGFIPWDDDIDVVMPRADYEKLCLIGPQKFAFPYFYQTEGTDRFFCRNFARLRNSQTTAIQTWEKVFNYPYNQGIFIDIFPMDNLPDDMEQRKQYYDEVGYYHSMSWQMRNYVYFFHQDKSVDTATRLKRYGKHLLYKYVQRKRRNYLNYLDKCDELLQMYNTTDTNYVGESVLPPLGRWVWKREWVEEVEWVPFEMLKVPVPVGYEECLKSGFGEDWRTPRQVPNLHGNILFDVDKPYTEYLKQK